MKNNPVGRFEAKDLDAQVEKVLRGLNYPEPPLRLEDVRELLKLDRKYFNSADDGFLRETISRMKRAGKQIIRRPSILIDVIRKAELKALWIPDGKRIFIDESVPQAKQRWYEGHEIGHGLAPWHRDFLFGDDVHTLDPTFHEKLENEANYVAGRLLFLRDRFPQEAADSPIELGTVRALAKGFNNTLTSTLWRYVEEAHEGRALVGIVSPHRHDRGQGFDEADPCRYVIESPAFRERFGSTSEVQLFEIIEGYATWKRGGPLGDSEEVLTDKNGARHLFRFESFYNTHDVLTLGVYLRPAVFQVAGL